MRAKAPLSRHRISPGFWARVGGAQVHSAGQNPEPPARIDMVRQPDGRLALMETKLVEPQLFLFDVPEAADRLADAIPNLSAG